MRNTKQKNPSSNEFGIRTQTPPKVLKEAKQDNRALRKMASVWKARNYPDDYPTDLGTCWMCWMDLTGEMLQRWRVEPFSKMENHDLSCPLCGYMRWKGRVWYPFRFVRGYIGNPSSRFGMKRKKR